MKSFPGLTIRKNLDKSETKIVAWGAISRLNIINWRYNRPYDPTRLNEIEHQLNQNDNVDGIICVVKTGENLYECFDGIHRLEALKKLSNFKNCDHYCLIVQYYPTYNENQIKQKFECLNRCVPVPTIYMNDSQELEKKNSISSIVRIYKTKYKNMFKPTSRPNIPNENRDVFTDKLDEIMDDIGIYDKDSIIYLLEQFNMFMKNNVIADVIKITKTQKNKCIKNNCFIFAKRDWKGDFVRLFNENIISIQLNNE
jgi:uncharacterized ParB-like nuclease family protein